MKKLNKMTLTALTALALAGVGVTVATGYQVHANSQSKITQVTAKKTFAETAKLALAEAKSGKVVDIDFKVKSNTPVYDVTVLDGTTETKYRIDANSGAILKTKIEIEDDMENQYLNQATTKVDIKKIEEQAKKDYPSATIKSIELQAGATSTVYKVELVEGFQEIEAIYSSDDASKLFESVEFDD